MNGRTLVLAGLIAMCAVSVFASTAETEDSASTTKHPDFSNKVLLIYLTTKPAYPSYIMEDSRLCEIGNRLFLTGTYADTRREEDWRSGLETRIAWDAVVSYQVLTPKQYEKYLDDAFAGR